MGNNPNQEPYSTRCGGAVFFEDNCQRLYGEKFRRKNIFMVVVYESMNRFLREEKEVWVGNEHCEGGLETKGKQNEPTRQKPNAH